MHHAMQDGKLSEESELVCEISNNGGWLAATSSSNDLAFRLIAGQNRNGQPGWIAPARASTAIAVRACIIQAG